MRRSLLAVSLLLAIPASADAATVTVAGDPPAIQYQAEPGEVNVLDVKEVIDPARGLLLTETGAPLTVDATCLDVPLALCPLAPVVAHLGDRGDHASLLSFGSDTTVYGERGDDDILSSGLASYAYGGRGNDRVRVNSGGQAFAHGGSGNDTIRAGSAVNVSAFGDAGNDVIIHETSVAALLDGGSGRDVIVGLPNAFNSTVAHGGADSDVIAIASTGGSGRTARWTLTGDGGSDLIAGGPGSDTIDGGSGTDGIYAAGGGVDTITCGSGFDIVRADADDSVASDCEWRIIRAAAPVAPEVSKALRLAAR